MKKLRTDCYFYCESQDMSARVPNCGYDLKHEFGFCPCSENCEHYISVKEVDGLIRNIVLIKNGVLTALNDLSCDIVKRGE